MFPWKHAIKLCPKTRLNIIEALVGSLFHDFWFRPIHNLVGSGQPLGVAMGICIAKIVEVDNEHG